MSPAYADDCVGEGPDCAPAGDLAYDQEDMDFILLQIKYAERHAAGEELIDILPNASMPFGLRTVDGSFNNLIPGQEDFGQADKEFPSSTSRKYRPAQTFSPKRPFGPGDVPGGAGPQTHYNQGNGRTVEDSTPRLISRAIVNQSVNNPAAVHAAAENEDSSNVGPDITGIDQLNIPNVAVDEGLSAPINAFTTFFGQFFDHGLDLINKGGNGLVYMPLQPDDPLFNATPGAPNFMLLTRATLNAGEDGEIGTDDDVVGPINATTPHVDQQQTYASHPSSHMLIRHYEIRDGRLQSTGRLLNGYGNDGLLDTTEDGGMATWDTVQLQALEKFGIILDDFDGNNVPMMLVDPYGKFIPGPLRGMPQLVVGLPNSVVEGDIDNPVDATQAIRVNHNFFLDVAHSANPNGQRGPLIPDLDTEINARTDVLSGQTTRGIRASGAEITIETPECPEPPCETYDDELLGVHFACGDGRCNENIALTTIHSIFHREHNRLTNIAKRVILDTGDLDNLNEWLDTPEAGFPAWDGLEFSIADATLSHQAQTQTAIDDLDLDWNGERIFQAARFGTEMQYNRVVFDEFAPTLAGLKDAFEGYHTDIEPAINTEFSQSVYRFGHSMLTPTVDRFDTDFNTIMDTASGDNSQLGLFEAFLNPLALYNAGEDGQAVLDVEAATGAVIRGLTRTRANEIDEFVIGALQNNLVGLPLDLGAINIARGRDVGNPSLNAARRMFYADTLDSRMTPYGSWVDYLDNLRHEVTLVNFIAVYGTHPTIAGPDGNPGNSDDPEQTLAGKRRAACAIVSALSLNAVTYCTDTGFADEAGPLPPEDALDFLRSQGDWASEDDGVTITGLDDVDFWNGGLAEERMPFGGYLGSTHNYVFERQIESLQNGDRFYYVGRTNMIHLFSELESNSFTAMIMRNTDLGDEGAGSLHINIFSLPTHILEVAIDSQFGLDPEDESELVGLVIRDPLLSTTNIEVADPNRFLQYTGGDHVVLGGTTGDDTLIGGIGDDAIWGRKGNDRIEGGDGADLIEGGPGDDIITDLSGPDVIEGGPGNDAISSGNEEDVIFGDAGHDFIVNPSELGEIFAGLGNDFVFDGPHNGHIRGGAGNDWLENMGGGEDLFQADNGAAAEGGEPAIKGHDVLVSHGGNTDADMENGDDIVVDGPGIDRVEGQLGFDWVSFQNDRFGVAIDLDLSIFIRPKLPPSNDTILNRYDRVEGISGSSHGDILRGTANRLGTSSGNELVNFDLIDGLSDLVPQRERRVLPPDPVTGEEQFGWTDGDIIVSGGGSDLLVGEGGDDILDGDSALRVALEAEGVLFDGMEELFDPVFGGDLNPGDISISRVISDADPDNLDTDTAVFSGNRIDYSIEEDSRGRGPDRLRVTDLRPLASNLRADRPGNDGSDILFNVERLAFADGTEEIPTGIAGSAGLNNSLVTGSLTISGTPALDMELTASIDTVMDADNVSSSGTVDAAGVDWTWESELEPGSGFFQPIVRVGGLLGNGDALEVHGQTLLVGANEAGLLVRVAGIFQDEADVFEIVRSAPVLVALPPGGVINPDGPSSFNGTCGDIASLNTPIIENRSGPGRLPRLDFSILEVSLELFDNTTEFPDGFDGFAEQLVSNINLTFVSQETFMVTGTFSPEIVAITDLRGRTDNNEVDISWSIRGDAVSPLVIGPTSVSFSTNDCGVFATALLDGDSSVNGAASVVITLINGVLPVPPAAVPPATFNRDCADLSVLTPLVKNPSVNGRARLDFIIPSVPLAFFDNAATMFAPGFDGAAEQPVTNLRLTFVNQATSNVTGIFFASIAAIEDPVTLEVDEDNVDIVWSIRGADVTPLVDGLTTVTCTLDGCGAFATAVLNGDSSEDDAEDVVFFTVNGGPPIEPIALASFNGLCAELEGFTRFVENAGGLRLDIIIPAVPLALFDNTDEFPPGFDGEADQIVTNIRLTFVTDATSIVTGTFAPMVVAIENPMTLEVDPNNVDIVWSIRGDDVTPLVNGPTTATFNLDSCGTFATAELIGDSSDDDAQDVEFVAVNGSPPLPPPGTDGNSASFDGTCVDLVAFMPLVENASRPGLPGLDFTVPTVPLALFDNTEGLFSPGFGGGAAQLVENISLSFITDATAIGTGTFIASIVAITDPVTLAVDPDNVDIQWSIRGADVTPLVNGPTTAVFNLDGCGAFATAELQGDSSVEDTQDVVFAAINGNRLLPPAPAPAPGPGPGPGTDYRPAALFNGTCAGLNDFRPLVANTSTPGLPQLDIIIPAVPLALFDNTVAVFSPGFGGAVEQLVGNISFTFLTQATFLVTGTFSPQIVAITDPVTLAVDPFNVNIQWSIRGADVTPLVNGLTTATFTLNGCGMFATSELNGDSSVGDAQDVVFVTVNGSPEPPIYFLRSDCNGDGRGNIADVVFGLRFNFSGGATPPCLAACDANGDGAVIGTVVDAIYTLQHAFGGGSAPPVPYPECGPGLSTDAHLGCQTSLADCPLQQVNSE